MNEPAKTFAWIEQIPTAVAVVSNTFHFIAANQHFCTLVGRSWEQLQTCPYGDVSQVADLTAELPFWLKAFSQGQESVLRKRFMRADGSYVATTLFISAFPGDDANRQVLLQVATCQESKEGTGATAQLDAPRLLREMRDIAACAGHDLREQVRMVNSFLGILTAQNLDALNERQRNFLSQATSHCDRLGILLSGVVQFARASIVANGSHSSTCDHALDAALGHLQPVIEQHQAVITRQELPKVAVDPVQLTSVFTHLLENALIHRGEHPARIDISCAHQDQDWVFTIADSGPGIANSIHGLVFKPFFSTLAAPPQRRLGLGLALCQSAVERHGGRIWVDAAVTHGATIRFTLPDAQD